MEVRTIYPINDNKTISFSFEEAERIVPLLITISKRCKQEVNQYNSQLALYKGQKEKCSSIQDQINESLNRWGDKMRKLGLTPLSLWKVRIPGIEKSFFWEFPKDEIFLEN
jgi:hypothetical protein